MPLALLVAQPDSMKEEQATREAKMPRNNKIQAENIYRTAEANGWEVETNEYGELVILTEVQDPTWDAAADRLRRMYDMKHREAKRFMRG